MTPHILEMEEDTTADMEAEMAALGLPSSFLSRLQPTPPSSTKRKSERKPSSDNQMQIEEGEVAEPRETTSGEKPVPLPNVTFTSVRLYTPRGPAAVEVEKSAVLSFLTEAEEEISPFDGEGEVLFQPETTTALRQTMVEVLDGVENPKPLGYSEEEVRWEPVWDEHYQCYYFYNTQTGESTWEAPPGFENYSAELNPLVADVNSQENSSVAVGDETHPGFENHSAELSSLVADQQTYSDAVNSQESSAVIVIDEEAIASECRRDSGSVNICPGNGLVERMDDDEGRVSSSVAELEEEVIGDRGETSEDAKMMSVDETPLGFGAANSHIRFEDSEESSSCSSEEGDFAGVDWQEIREDAGEVEEGSSYKACWPSEKQGILSIHSGVRQHLKASRTTIRKRRLKSIPGIEHLDKVQLPGMVEMMDKSLIKYWVQRYSLFTKYDEGVKMDKEGWFSVTPEIIAEHQASRCGTGLVIDAFTGVGGNAIQFALKSHRVIAIDIDPVRVEYAQHNARIYGVADRIDFIVGDFFQLAPSLKADLVFLSPPWGGPEYLKQETFDLNTMLKPRDGCTLFKFAESIAPNIALFVPRNVDLDQLQELSWLTSPPLPCAVEENFVNNKLKAITAYYGEIAGRG